MLVSNFICAEQKNGVEVIYRNDLFIRNGESPSLRETLGDSSGSSKIVNFKSPFSKGGVVEYCVSV